jgi:hypothetical protein
VVKTDRLPRPSVLGPIWSLWIIIGITQLSSEKPELFKGRHFNHLLIIQAVRWYGAYKSSCWRIREIPDCASSPKAHEESAMDLVEGATKRLANELSKQVSGLR